MRLRMKTMPSLMLLVTLVLSGCSGRTSEALLARYAGRARLERHRRRV